MRRAPLFLALAWAVGCQLISNPSDLIWSSGDGGAAPADGAVGPSDGGVVASTDAAVADGGIVVVDPASGAQFTLGGTQTAPSAPVSRVAVCHLHAGSTGDLVVGIPLAQSLSSHRPSSGQVLVFFGKADWSGELEASSADVTIGGLESEAEQLGDVLACADLAGDGYEDLIIGAPEAGSAHAGRVYVLDGQQLAAGGTFSTSSFHPDGGVAQFLRTAIEGPAAGANAGAAVVGARLGSASGPASLAIGAPGHDADGGAGAVYLLSPADLASSQHLTLGGATGSAIAGLSAGAGFGSALAAGPTSAAGHDDLAIAAPGTAPLGVVYLLRAALDGGVPDMASAIAVTGPPTSGFGTALAMGRATGGETTDLVVGAPRANLGGKPDTAGAVYVLQVAGLAAGTQVDVASAGSSVLLATLSGPSVSSEFGARLAVVDSAGGGDLWIGAPGAQSSRGIALLVRAGATIAGDLDTATVGVALRVLGTNQGDRLGDSLAGGSLQTGNSLADFVVVAPGVTVGSAGALYGFLDGTAK